MSAEQLTDSGPHERARSHGLPWVDTERAHLLLVKRMCEDFYRTTADEGLKERIAGAYKQVTGATIRNFAMNSTKFSSPYLKGPPGHGKSEVVMQAAATFARLTGMDYHPEVPEGRELGANDFVMVTRELTGETSSLATRGIFDKVDQFGRSVTKRVPYADFEAARSAGLAMLLFDDVASALEPVKTSLLGLLRRRQSEGMDFRSMFPVLTGNLGDADNTMTTPDGAAFLGRTEAWYIEDTIDAFSTRMSKTFDDDLGDGFVSAYLRLHKECFSPPLPATQDQNIQWPQPRTWTETAKNLRDVIHIYRSDPKSPVFGPFKSGGGLTDAIRLAAAPVGAQHAALFAAFAQSMMSETFPLAEKIFRKGVDASKREIETVIERAGMGNRNDAEHNEAAFQHQFAEACAAVAGARIAARPEMVGNNRSEVIRAFAEELATFYQVMMSPFIESDGKASILKANQTLAAWTLGRRLQNISALSSPRTAGDEALGRRSLDVGIAHEASMKCADLVNQWSQERVGKPAIGNGNILTLVYGPLTGDNIAAVAHKPFVDPAAQPAPA